MKKRTEPKLDHRRPWTIGIVGSRRRDSDADYIACVGKFGEVYQPGDRIVSGGCSQGGDRFAEEIAKTHGITITIHYPRREQLDAGLMAVNRRAAYARINYARNMLIAEDCDVLIALCADDRTGGTEDTVKKAIKLGKTVVYA